MCIMRYNKSAQQVLNFFKTGSKAPFPEGAFFFRNLLIMILFNDKMYSKVIIIIKKRLVREYGICISSRYSRCICSYCEICFKWSRNSKMNKMT
ncbi:hypothetical protein F8514_14235 [Bacillus toyonensis]|nr:hypothetical protein F8503_01005 [Bacillus toyonensis]QEQ16597.1 hypothetical protein F0362_08070 [Bacillus sp. BS98]KAB2386953.1 hypothetical protein F8507_02840 [Bacillus toyonensis]KAB2407899.1 hypothetical protein F8514_14235 [Bacillus toyonensis]QWG97001.1 hypothetical protein EXW33_20720 [Bacillus toyonensis]